MKKIERRGINYTVLFESVAIRHFFGSEIDFKEWLKRTEKKLKNK